MMRLDRRPRPLRRIAALLVLAVTALPSPARAIDQPPTATNAEPRPVAAGPTAPTWRLLVPDDDRVVFRGVVTWDEAGADHGPIPYAVPNALGALAAVLTHSLLVDMSKSRQKADLQAKADEVLAPYRESLDRYGARALYTQAVALTSSRRAAWTLETPHRDGEAVVSARPVFSLAKDGLSLTLDNEVSIAAPDPRAGTVAAVRVRVVSDARQPTQEGAEPAAHWGAEDAAALKAWSAALLAHSLEIVVDAASASSDGAGDPPQRTFRYLDGRSERFERGQLVSEACGRALVKTLRGTWLSIPVRAAHAASDPGCRPLQATPGF